MRNIFPPSRSREYYSERAQRIEHLLARGVKVSLRAYESGKYIEEYSLHEMDRVVLGMTLPLAHALLRAGDPDSRKLAEKIIREVMDKQEQHPDHPHRGNWPRWTDEEEITDLNSGPFILRWLIPLLADQHHQLSDELLEICRHCLQLGLEEIERMDVSVIYTNIHLMTVFALIVGGEWLGIQHFQEVGKSRWEMWLRFTVESGAPHEYNSTTYLGMDLTVLAKLQHMTLDPAISLQSRIMYERFWLHVAVHFHRPTRQLAGPNARCYWTAMITGRERLTEILWRETGWAWLLQPGPYEIEAGEDLPINLELALTNFWLPNFVTAWLEHQSKVMPCEVYELASKADAFDLTTYHTPTYTLGSASQTYSTGTGILAIEQMANHLLLHYAKPENPGGWGMMYTRYVVNNQHWGTLGSFRFRPRTNFFDQGNFASLQKGNKVIALYALLPLYDTYVHSLKTLVVFQSGQTLERVWVNDLLVLKNQPCPFITHEDWIIVEDGGVYVGIRPLKPSILSREVSIKLEQGPLGELWIAIYNYEGMSKRFWDYASLGGAYWRGNLKAGFILEVAQRSDFPDAAVFLSHLRQSVINDTVTDSIRSVTYQSGEDELSLNYDLWNTVPKERYLNGAPFKRLNLQSPLGVQGDTGSLCLGTASLTTEAQPMWLIVQDLDPSQRAWIAVNPLNLKTHVTFETPNGVVMADEWGMGRLEWRAPEGGKQILIVDTLTPIVGLQVPDGVTITFINHPHEITGS